MEEYETGSSGLGAAFGAIGIFYLAFIVIIVVALWKIFEKAGKPGWAAIIPIYNLFVLLEIVGKPAWWLILFLIPVVNIIIAIIVYHNLSLSFGKGAGTTILMFVFGIGLLILGFGDAKYIGPQKS